MGSVIARRLLETGHDVTVHNRSPERATPLLDLGARWAADAGELASEVDLLLTMVADDAALEAVTTGSAGVLTSARPGLTYADLSTVSPAASQRVAEAAQTVGVPYLRAPVSGSTVLAASGELSVLASGPAPALEAFDPVLSSIAQRVFYLGAEDEARVMKLAVNTLVATTVVGLSEALAFGERSGLAWDSMLEVFAESVVGSPLVKYKTASLAARDFEAAFTTSMMAKDLAVALELGHARGATMPTTALSNEILRMTAGLGWGDSDFSAAVLMYQHLAGTPGARPAGEAPEAETTKE